MIWLVKLYPAAWRQRYGEEFQAILAGQRFSPGLILDVMAGAIDARLSPQSRKPAIEPEKGDTMTIAMLKRCALGGYRLSPQERKEVARGTILASLAIAALYLVLTKLYHAAPAVQAIGLAGYPSIVLFYEQMAHLRRRPITTRALLVGGMLTLLYLFMWGICLLAVRL